MGSSPRSQQKIELLIIYILAWMAVMALVLLALVWPVCPPTISVGSDVQRWTNELAARAADPAWQAEQERLHKKHGLNHVIIYTPDGTYYFNKQGQKCPFM